MVTLHFINIMMHGKRMDTKYNKDHDVTTPVGLQLALDLRSLLGVGCPDQMSPECGSFSTLCAYHHKRNADNAFLGDESRQFVVTGNRQMEVASLFYFLSHICDALPSYEQSVGSCQPNAGSMATVLQFTRSSRVSFSHAKFGSKNTKRFQFWSTNGKFTQFLQPGQDMHVKKVSKDKVERLVTRSGKKFTGVGKRLKASEHYSAGLGHHFAMAYAKLVQ